MITLFDSVADQLAEHGYAVADRFISEEEVDAIIAPEFFERDDGAFRKAGIGQQRDYRINEVIRGDYIEWLNKTNAGPAISVYLSRVDELMRYINQTLFLSLKDFEVHKTIYPAGAYYKRHLDQFLKDDHRRLSLICYLNREWKEEYGGQLRLYPHDQPVDVLPVAGRIVCFRSELLEHEVLPATRERLSLTGWMLDQLSDLRHL
jgi:SM-20-related protein